MSPTKEDLEQEFASLSNSRLEAIVRAGTYSKTAVDVAIAELRARGVDVRTQDTEDTPPETVEDQTSQQGDTHVDLVTVYQTDNPFTANVVRNLLASQGLFAHVWGLNLGITHTFWSFRRGACVCK